MSYILYVYVTKTERMEVTTVTQKKHKLNIQVMTKNLAPFDDEKTISLSLSVSGAVVVHDCDNVFMRSDSIESIEKVMLAGTEYTIIHFKKEV
jgi:hypothetical protein